MSVQAITWAFKQDITPSAAKFVLVALANYASEDGYCYPSQKTLGRLTGQTDRSVRTHLAMLEEMGLIQRESRVRPDGGLLSDGYYILLDPPEDSSGGVRPVPETVSASPGKDFLSPRYPFPHPPEDSSANTKEDTKEQTKGDTKVRATFPKDVLVAIEEMPHFTDAPAMHDAIEQMLTRLDFACEREYKVSDRGDGRVGAIDLVATRGDTTLALELDSVNPRTKSIFKLQQVPGACRVVLLREGNERYGETLDGLDAVIRVGAIRFREPKGERMSSQSITACLTEGMQRAREASAKQRERERKQRMR